MTPFSVCLVSNGLPRPVVASFCAAEFPFAVARALLESRVRKILSLCLWLGVVAWSSGAETLTLTDGASLSGTIIKFDDNGLTLRLPGEVYAATNLSWSRLSQESLKQLQASPKIKPLVEAFIEPDESQRPAKPQIQIKEVTRLTQPANPSILGGLIHSSAGWVLLLVLYLANLFAAYEVSIFRGRPAWQVMALAAVLPVIGLIIFLAMPSVVTEEPPPEGAGEGEAEAAPPVEVVEEVQVVEAAPVEATAQPVIFTRGKFTFNKRFVETKFAGFVGSLNGDGLKYVMAIKTLAGEFAVEKIAQVGSTDMILETAQGQVSVPFGEIQEIILHPRSA